MSKRKRPLADDPVEGPPTPTPTAGPEPVKKSPRLFCYDRQDCYTLLALLTAAVCIRGYSLQFFQVISTDGTSYALNARAFAQGDFHGVGISGFYSVLIAAANLFISDLETAGRVVSVVFGSLLVVPLYLLGKSMFSRHVAVAAALTVIVWPSLVASSCEVMTQATHTTLQLSAVYLCWRAFKQPTLLSGGVAGFCLGLAYLTRAESLLLFICIPLALAILNHKYLRQNGLPWAAYCGSFLIPFLANMFLVHHLTGEWQLSAKTDSALNDALSYYLNIPDLTYTPGYEPKGYLDILKEHPDFIWKNSAKNMKALRDTILPAAVWLLAAIGFLSGGFSREKNTPRLFLLATFTPVAVLVVFYYISSGYVEAYLPVIFLLAACGFSAAAAKFTTMLTGLLPAGKSQLRLQTPLLLTAALIYAVMIVTPQIRKNVSDAEYRPEMDNYRRAEKHLGLLLKDSLPPGKIMTRWARIAFYAERDWMNIPAGTACAEVVRLARKNGVRFFIADGLLYSNRPELGMEIFAPLADPSRPPGRFFNTDSDYRIEGLRPFMLYSDPRSMGVVVYEIDPAAG